MPFRFAKRDEVPDDQEVVREAHLPDRLQLEPEPVLELGRDLFVALAQAFLAELDEVVEGVAAVRGRERREQDPAELHRHGAALGDLERAGDRLGIPGEVRLPSPRGLEVELVGVEAPVVRVRERVARLDAEERLVRARVFVAQVVDVAGGDEREARRGRELRELGVDLLLDLEARRPGSRRTWSRAPKMSRQPGELRLGLVSIPVLERLADAAREAAGERDRARSSARRGAPSRRAACSSSPRGSRPRRA